MDNFKKNLAKKIRKMIIETSYRANACHIGSALSCVEILIDIDQKMKSKDIFIFGKASGVCAYYCLLAIKGIIPKNKLVYYLKNYPLPDTNVPGIIANMGSLGHGLPIAVGLALADRKRDVYLLMSDGELSEGTTWESLLFKNQHQLNNLKIYVDYNGLQATDYIKNVLDLPLDFLKRFGKMNIINATKGKGVDFMENKIESHYHNLTLELYERAIRQISS